MTRPGSRDSPGIGQVSFGGHAGCVRAPDNKQAAASSGEGWLDIRFTGSKERRPIEVYGSHCGLGANPLVFHAVADRLAQEQGKWKPFATPSPVGWLFSVAGHA